MTVKLIHENRPNFKGVKLGPRLVRDVQLRITALQSRWPGARTHADWAELGRLRQLLKLLQTGGDGDV